ncbi:hypothetical protein [Halobacillus litoralis]|uniref:hypothetical protein n=1 Tax=Halobacillus litoralis TaxID=45668 RepID=UPI001CFC8B42|nr:hypothetical protein [Halobacillus litoralis]
MFDEEEIRRWEEGIDQRRFNHWKTEKHYKDPERERLFKWRKVYYLRLGNEEKSERRFKQKSFRMKLRSQVIRGDDHLPVPHEYKTYGWETW